MKLPVKQLILLNTYKLIEPGYTLFGKGGIWTHELLLWRLLCHWEFECWKARLNIKLTMEQLPGFPFLDDDVVEGDGVDGADEAGQK